MKIHLINEFGGKKAFENLDKSIAMQKASATHHMRGNETIC